MEGEGVYGRIHSKKPDNVVRIMIKNFSSLRLFVEGPARHKKVRQLNKLVWDYGVDLLAGCKTRMDWHYIVKEEDRFCNLFGSGQPTRGCLQQISMMGKLSRTNGGESVLPPLAGSLLLLRL